MNKTKSLSEYKRRKRIIDGIGTAIVWLFVIAALFPIAWMILTSFMTQSDIATGRIGIPNHWKNYVDMWKNVDFFNYFKNSVIVCGITTVVALGIATFAGYAVARFKFPGSGIFGAAVLATQMVPGIMFLLPLYLMFIKIQDTLGIQIINTYAGLILVYSAFYIPFSIWILRGFFAGIPKELEEAAIIDGCSGFEAFLKVILPIARIGLIATGIYIFLMAWDELLFAWVLTTSSDVATIPVGIRLYVGNYQNRYDLLMAAGCVTTLPPLMIFFGLQKQFISGMTAGAVKA
ncbi:carbohydrate ABC transporter permease [Cellulosilyticum ruminicola]|uniref:carbohydrate ABC transporter permease n=1 Tax=Cellulosilyticum ruminicola TaxID=425254 RepID=UPI0006D06D0A|nr:carbohydrate ABC transporter permease [Cellulosilyticum ruminicola]